MKKIFYYVRLSKKQNYLNLYLTNYLILYKLNIVF